MIKLSCISEKSLINAKSFQIKFLAHENTPGFQSWDPQAGGAQGTAQKDTITALHQCFAIWAEATMDKRSSSTFSKLKGKDYRWDKPSNHWKQLI